MTARHLCATILTTIEAKPVCRATTRCAQQSWISVNLREKSTGIVQAVRPPRLFSHMSAMATRSARFKTSVLPQVYCKPAGCTNTSRCSGPAGVRMRGGLRFGGGGGSINGNGENILPQQVMSKGFLQTYFWRGDRNRFTTTINLSGKLLELFIFAVERDGVVVEEFRSVHAWPK